MIKCAFQIVPAGASKGLNAFSWMSSFKGPLLGKSHLNYVCFSKTKTKKKPFVMLHRTLIPPTLWLPTPPNSTKASCLFHIVFYSFEICRRSNKVLAVSCKQRAKYNVSCKVFGQLNMQDCETRVQGSEIGNCVLPQLCASPAQSLLLSPVAFPYL